MKDPKYIVITIFVLTFLSSCAGSGASYIPIIDGPRDSVFYSDLSVCQQLAQQRTYMNADTQTDAVIGGVIGGIIGLLDDGDVEDAVAGAAIGAGAAAADSAYDVIKERKVIVQRCMKNRGHNVVG